MKSQTKRLIQFRTLFKNGKLDESYLFCFCLEAFIYCLMFKTKRCMIEKQNNVVEAKTQHETSKMVVSRHIKQEPGFLMNAQTFTWAKKYIFHE